MTVSLYNITRKTYIKVTVLYSGTDFSSACKYTRTTIISSKFEALDCDILYCVIQIDVDQNVPRK